MTRAEKKEELIGLFSSGSILIGDMLDEAMDFAEKNIEKEATRKIVECSEFLAKLPHWISVEDELPPKSEYDALSNNVLATDDKEIYESVYNHDFGEWFTHDLWAINNITHWMPLPAPPEHIADVSKKISSSEIPNNQKGGKEC